MIPGILLIPIMIMVMFIGALGAFFFKKAAKDFNFSVKGILTNKNFHFGVLTYILGSIVYTLLLKFEELNIIFALASIQYIWAAILSVFFLKEKMTTEKVLGMTLIISGTFIVALLR